MSSVAVVPHPLNFDVLMCPVEWKVLPGSLPGNTWSVTAKSSGTFLRILWLP